MSPAISGVISTPSMIFSGSSPPARAVTVGNRSIWLAILFIIFPAGITAGHFMMHGTFCPPSNDECLASLRPPLFPACAPKLIQAPLSEVNTTRVFSSAPISLMASRTSPTLQSTSIMASPKSPCSLLPLNRSATGRGT